MKVKCHENCIYHGRYVWKKKNVDYFAVYEESMTQTEQIHSLKLKNKQ